MSLEILLSNSRSTEITLLSKARVRSVLKCHATFTTVDNTIG